MILRLHTGKAQIPDGTVHDTEGAAALIHQYEAQGADRVITNAFDGHGQAEQEHLDDHYGPAGGGSACTSS